MKAPPNTLSSFPRKRESRRFTGIPGDFHRKSGIQIFQAFLPPRLRGGDELAIFPNRPYYLSAQVFIRLTGRSCRLVRAKRNPTGDCSCCHGFLSGFAALYPTYALRSPNTGEPTG